MARFVPVVVIALVVLIAAVGARLWRGAEDAAFDRPLDGVETEPTPGARRPLAEETSSGATDPEPLRGAHVEAPEGGTVVTARLIESGSPLADREVSLRIGGLPRAVRTGSNGRFATALTAEDLLRVRAGDVRVRAPDRAGGDFVARVEAGVIERPVHDLGDVTVKPLPRLLAGIVVDDLGEPVPHIQLVFGPRKAVKLDEGDAEGVSDADGRFEVRGTWAAAGAAMTAIAVDATFISRLHDFIAGADDAVIRIERAGVVSVPVRMPRGMSAGQAYLFAEDDEVPYRRGSFETDASADRHVAEFAQIRIGRYEARVDVGGRVRVVGTVEVTPHSRVETPLLDLNAEFRVIEVVAIDPDGSPAAVLVEATCGDTVILGRGRRQSVVVPRGPCTLRLDPARRFRHVVIHDPPDLVRVHLRPRIPVDVIANVALREGTHLLVHIGEEDSSGRLDTGSSRVTIHLAAPGRQRIAVTVRTPRHATRIKNTVTGETAREVVGYDEFRVSPDDAFVEILDTDGGQTITAPIDAALLEEIYERTRE